MRRISCTRLYLGIAHPLHWAKHVAHCPIHSHCRTTGTVFSWGLRNSILCTPGIPIQDCAPQAPGVPADLPQLRDMPPGFSGHIFFSRESPEFPIYRDASPRISWVCLHKWEKPSILRLSSEPWAFPPYRDIQMWLCKQRKPAR